MRRRAPTATGQGYSRDALRIEPRSLAGNRSAGTERACVAVGTRLICVADGRAEHGARREAGNRAQRFMRASSVLAFELQRTSSDTLSRAAEDVTSQQLDARGTRGYERDRFPAVRSRPPDAHMSRVRLAARSMRGFLEAEATHASPLRFVTTSPDRLRLAHCHGHRLARLRRPHRRHGHGRLHLPAGCRPAPAAAHV
jgi:hypothetical protein